MNGLTIMDERARYMQYLVRPHEALRGDTMKDQHLTIPLPA